MAVYDPKAGQRDPRLAETLLASMQGGGAQPQAAGIGGSAIPYAGGGGGRRGDGGGGMAEGLSRGMGHVANAIEKRGDRAYAEKMFERQLKEQRADTASARSFEKEQTTGSQTFQEGMAAKGQGYAMDQLNRSAEIQAEQQKQQQANAVAIAEKQRSYQVADKQHAEYLGKYSEYSAATASNVMNAVALSAPAVQKMMEEGKKWPEISQYVDTLITPYLPKGGVRQRQLAALNASGMSPEQAATAGINIAPENVGAPGSDMTGPPASASADPLANYGVVDFETGALRIAAQSAMYKIASEFTEQSRARIHAIIAEEGPQMMAETQYDNMEKTGMVLGPVFGGVYTPLGESKNPGAAMNDFLAGITAAPTSRLASTRDDAISKVVEYLAANPAIQKQLKSGTTENYDDGASKAQQALLDNVGLPVLREFLAPLDYGREKGLAGNTAYALMSSSTSGTVQPLFHAAVGTAEYVLGDSMVRGFEAYQKANPDKMRKVDAEALHKAVVLMSTQFTAHGKLGMTKMSIEDNMRDLQKYKREAMRYIDSAPSAEEAVRRIEELNREAGVGSDLYDAATIPQLIPHIEEKLQQIKAMPGYQPPADSSWWSRSQSRQ